jgi:hypothetical protein
MKTHPTKLRADRKVMFTPRVLGERNVNSVFDWSTRGLKGFRNFKCKALTIENPHESFRFAGYAHKIIKLNHTGWFTDEYQYETTKGVLFRMTHGRFIAGCTDAWNWCDKSHSGPVMFKCDSSGNVEIYHDETSAAIAADHIAENWAELCREDNVKQSAESRIEDMRCEVKRLKDRRLYLLSLSRHPIQLSLLKDCRDEVMKLLKNIKLLTEDYSATIKTYL